MNEYINTNAHLEAQVSILRADLDHWVKKWSNQNEQLNTVVGELAEREAEAEARLRDCKKDAERYRWLRPRMTGKDTMTFARRKDLGDAYCTILDDDIDAAMTQKEGA
jgi:ribosomal protein RSM22 (predicted rRNA methylase)